MTCAPHGSWQISDFFCSAAHRLVLDERCSILSLLLRFPPKSGGPQVGQVTHLLSNDAVADRHDHAATKLRGLCGILLVTWFLRSSQSSCCRTGRLRCGQQQMARRKGVPCRCILCSVAEASAVEPHRHAFASQEHCDFKTLCPIADASVSLRVFPQAPSPSRPSLSELAWPSTSLASEPRKPYLLTYLHELALLAAAVPGLFNILPSST